MAKFAVFVPNSKNFYAYSISCTARKMPFASAGNTALSQSSLAITGNAFCF